MKVQLIAHTAIAPGFFENLPNDLFFSVAAGDTSPRAVVALTAIRTCYSANKPSEIVSIEGDKYFGREATDGQGGKEADRLFRHITRSGHTSTLEHITYTFAIEGVSRSLLAQLTRHRQFSFSVQSQRYVRFASDDKSNGFESVIPPSLEGKFTESNGGSEGVDLYLQFMATAQAYYDELRAMGVPAEDARFVLPNGATCNLVMTANLRALLEFYGKRKTGRGAQWEIAELAELLRTEIVNSDKWVGDYFEAA